jgi:hypothetical protein
MPRRLQRAALPFALVGVAAIAACPAPDQGPSLSAGQVMIETQDALTGVNNELAVLQFQIDSLRGVLNTQDSLIRVMFNLQGNPLPPKPIIPPE